MAGEVAGSHFSGGKWPKNGRANGRIGGTSPNFSCPAFCPAIFRSFWEPPGTWLPAIFRPLLVQGVGNCTWHVQILQTFCFFKAAEVALLTSLRSANPVKELQGRTPRQAHGLSLVLPFWVMSCKCAQPIQTSKTWKPPKVHSKVRKMPFRTPPSPPPRKIAPKSLWICTKRPLHWHFDGRFGLFYGLVGAICGGWGVQAGFFFRCAFRASGNCHVSLSLSLSLVLRGFRHSHDPAELGESHHSDWTWQHRHSAPYARWCSIQGQHLVGQNRKGSFYLG